MTKTEYRLKTPNNILFLIHYMEISKFYDLALFILYSFSFVEEPTAPVRTALPATKISPIYLQQQFFNQLKHQMAQLAAMKRSPSPSLVRPPPGQMMNRVPSGMANKLQASKSQSQAQVPTVSNANVMRSSQQNVNPPHSTTTATTPAEPIPIEASLDIFDSFSDFEAAHYRLNTIKPFLSRLLESTTQTTQSTNSPMSPALEADLIAASRKKISSIQERSEKLKTSRKESIQQFKSEQKIFWDALEQLEKSSNPDSIYKQLLQSQDHSMDQDMEVSYTSL